jgi:hypothetical protein
VGNLQLPLGRAPKALPSLKRPTHTYAPSIRTHPKSERQSADNLSRFHQRRNPRTHHLRTHPARHESGSENHRLNPVDHVNTRDSSAMPHLAPRQKGVTLHAPAADSSGMMSSVAAAQRGRECNIQARRRVRRARTIRIGMRGSSLKRDSTVRVSWSYRK